LAAVGVGCGTNDRADQATNQIADLAVGSNPGDGSDSGDGSNSGDGPDSADAAPGDDSGSGIGGAPISNTAGDADALDGGPGDALGFGDPADYGFAPVNGDEQESMLEGRGEQSVDVDLPAPDAIVPVVADELEAARDIGETLDAVEPLHDGPPDPGEGPASGPADQSAGLDDDAALACANTEIALGHFDEGRGSIAAERLALAAQHARSSGQPSVQAWAAPLDALGPDLADDDLAVVVGFIAACAERGYEL
jgi:hypothetical protein